MPRFALSSRALRRPLARLLAAGEADLGVLPVLSSVVERNGVDECLAAVGRLTVPVFDDTSIHRATCGQQRLRACYTAGLQLQFLPANLSKLNRIEILRRIL